MKQLTEYIHEALTANEALNYSTNDKKLIKAIKATNHENSAIEEYVKTIAVKDLERVKELVLLGHAHVSPNTKQQFAIWQKAFNMSDSDIKDFKDKLRVGKHVTFIMKNPDADGIGRFKNGSKVFTTISYVGEPTKNPKDQDIEVDIFGETYAITAGEIIPN